MPKGPQRVKRSTEGTEPEGLTEDERTVWQRRFQTIRLTQYNEGVRFDYRGPPDMTEYIGGGKLGRGPRPIKEPSPEYRPSPGENWQRPLSQVKEGQSRWTGTPPNKGGEKQRVRKRPDRNA